MGGTPLKPAAKQMCSAGEWHRDGRGLWAERRCQYYQGHEKEHHSFGAWRYNVQPPAAEAELARLQAAIEQIAIEMRKGGNGGAQSQFDHGYRFGARKFAARLEAALARGGE